jgi:sialate O-acetylesterase
MKPAKIILCTCVLLLSSLIAFTQVRLPKLIRDSMILQRDEPIKIWGWAAKNEKIKVEFNHKTYKASTDINGTWNILLPPTKAGGPYTITIAASNSITLKEILFGDVWVCAGQSNMVHQMELHSVLYEDEIAKANYPDIRHYWVPTATNLQEPKDDLSYGYWKSANPKNVLQFSAVAYFFAKKVYEKFHIPIGLINASVGGSPIETWISEEGFKDFSIIQNKIQINKDTAYVNGLNRNVLPIAVVGNKDHGLIEKWYDLKYTPKGWHTINVPGYWEDQGIKDLDGIVWYRKEIEVPKIMNNKSARLFLGRIVDADMVYVNGIPIGSTAYQYPQRRYTIPAGLLHEGKNLLVIKVQNNAGKGGFVPDKPYYFFADKDTIDLKGYWQYKVGEVFSPKKSVNTSAVTFNPQSQPTAFYNAMIAPLIKYNCKGFLWYQGESNIGNQYEYEKLQAALINDWRKKWEAPNAPFLYAQLPGFMEMNYSPVESQWAHLREAQLNTLSMSNTGMAVTIDLGEWNDIHPDKKKEVGERLAIAALKVAYHDKDIVHSGPLYQSSVIENNKIIISFNHNGSGLISNDGEELAYFAIAGLDKKFVWAKAKIIHGNINGELDKVVIWSDEIVHPVYVRYAWSDNPDGANLYNKEGLPASPFRTDK